MTESKRKLIEVALPLEAINRESAREKAISRNHPSSLHYWWARRPHAACRAVLFAQLVDDPSSYPELFPTEESQSAERRRLFDILEALAPWEANERTLEAGRREISRSVGDSISVLDPFAGGGTIPFEAQRLGLEAYASDINPVAVLINHALLEMPWQWSNKPPVNACHKSKFGTDWRGSQGLVQDVKWYGELVLKRFAATMRHLYPDIELPTGGTAPVIAWLWARTVRCSNPACSVMAPLAKSFWLCKKKTKRVWLAPVPEGAGIRFRVMEGSSGPDPDGTVGRTGATCLRCRSNIPLEYIRDEGQRGLLGTQLLAVVAEGRRERIYLEANAAQEEAADVESPQGLLEEELSTHPQYMGTPRYGFTRFHDLYTARQLTGLETLRDLIKGVRADVERDARAVYSDDASEALAYVNTIMVYLAFLLDRVAVRSCALSFWNPIGEKVDQVFARQTLSLVWSFPEASLVSSSSGGIGGQLSYLLSAIGIAVPKAPAEARQADARRLMMASNGHIVCTDPPYYDNVPYADLSDFFYVWLRDLLRPVYPDLFSTALTPKSEELVADEFRFGGRPKAKAHFERGLFGALKELARLARPDVPLTIFYAFRQASSTKGRVTSTGWETFLQGLISAQLAITGTWPMRTERTGRLRETGANALASSVLLVCRPRPESASKTRRRDFLDRLRNELPVALRELAQSSLAPIDLAQAAIGPGMRIFTGYSAVLEPDGSSMQVSTALGLINQVLDEILTEQDGDFDVNTRFCVKWFSNYGWNEQPYGRADELSRTTGAAVEALVRGDIFRARAGRARLVGADELAERWDPAADNPGGVWSVVLRLANVLDKQGFDEAARLMVEVNPVIDLDAARELTYHLFSICEKRGWTQTALLFNGLGTSWSDLSAASRVGGSRTPPPGQGTLDLDEVGE